MRWSWMYIPTLREDPAEADTPGHRLLLRAGYIRQAMPGHYSLLPLAVRVRAKVMAVIREELEAIGAQEVALPTMLPAPLWQRSGRWDAPDEPLFRLWDRKGGDAALAVSYAEGAAALAAELSSYKQLPQIWYQFQTAYRDEPRPRAGLARTREFTLLNSYSFDLSPDGLDRALKAHQAACERIFARLDIPVIPVVSFDAPSGGSASTEFMCPSAAGEDEVAHCAACGYAAELDRATSRLPQTVDAPGLPKPERFDTPGARTIDDLATRFDAPADRQIKTLVYAVDGQLTLVLLRGDHTLVERKLLAATGASAVRPAEADEIRGALGASPGSLGAVGVTDLPIIADEALRGRRDMFTGANIDDVHLRGVDIERDIAVGRWADLRAIRAGEPCPTCDRPLQVQRAMAVGRLRPLGQRYAEAFGVSVLDAEGRRTAPVMGGYALGVERALAAVVEYHHDDRGIVWPLAVAPFQVAVVTAQPDDSVIAAGEDIYRDLRAAGVDVIVDDRRERAGVKFRDVELVGIPLRVTVGKRGLADGVVELTIRATGDTTRVPLRDLVAEVQRVMATLP